MKAIAAALIAATLVAGGIILTRDGEDVKVTQPESQAIDNSETPQPETTAPLTEEEVAKHNSAEDCWTIIRGNAYDITPFISSHPGGDEILRACGVDATTLFETRTTESGEQVGSGTPHSSSAQSQLQQFELGPLEQ